MAALILKFTSVPRGIENSVAKPWMDGSPGFITFHGFKSKETEEIRGEIHICFVFSYPGNENLGVLVKLPAPLMSHSVLRVADSERRNG